MQRLALASVALVSALGLVPALGAQAGSSIGRRVTAAPDGEVRITYATRSDVCGDGRDGVSIGRSMYFAPNVESYGGWSNVRCERGPARVTLTVEGHRVVGVRTRVAGVWPAASPGTTDLGTAPAADAAAYFISLVPALDGASRRDNPLLAAAIADSANVAPDMLRLGRMTSLSRETRRRAVHWSGALGDASMVAPLVEFARANGSNGGSAEDVGPGNGLEGAATAALSMIPDAAGIPALTELARNGSESVRKGAVFWLGQRDDERSRAVVRTVAADDRETVAVRKSAIFALGQGEASTKADETFLESLFGRLDNEKLKEQVLFAMSQRASNSSTQWLIAQARDARQPIEVRRKAVFWAGQARASVADLTSIYQAASERQLREHVIFVLSQREEDAATSALIAIARTDADHEMRRKALFWLAQKDDPRVTKLITDLVVK